jgi:ABC-type sugar transport system ATPase subunit
VWVSPRELAACTRDLFLGMYAAVTYLGVMWLQSDHLWTQPERGSQNVNQWFAEIFGQPEINYMQSVHHRDEQHREKHQQGHKVTMTWKRTRAQQAISVHTPHTVEIQQSAQSKHGIEVHVHTPYSKQNLLSLTPPSVVTMMFSDLRSRWPTFNCSEAHNI